MSVQIVMNDANKLLIMVENFKFYGFIMTGAWNRSSQESPGA